MVKSKKTSKKSNSKGKDVKLSRKTICHRVSEKSLAVPQSLRVSLRLQNKLDASPLPPNEKSREKQTSDTNRIRRNNVNDTANNTRVTRERLERVSKTKRDDLVELQLSEILAVSPLLYPKSLVIPSLKGSNKPQNKSTKKNASHQNKIEDSHLIKNLEGLSSTYSQTREQILKTARKSEGNITEKISSTKIKFPKTSVYNPACETQGKTSNNSPIVPLRRSKRGLIIQQNGIFKSQSDADVNISTLLVVKTRGRQSRETPTNVASKTSRLETSSKTHKNKLKESTLNESLGPSETFCLKTKGPQTRKSAANLLNKAPRKTSCKTPRNTTVPKKKFKKVEVRNKNSRKSSITSASKTTRKVLKETLPIDPVHLKRSQRILNRLTKIAEVVKARSKQSQKTETKTASKTARQNAKVSKKSEVITKKLIKNTRNLKTEMKIKSNKNRIETFSNASTLKISNLNFDRNTEGTSDALDQTFITPLAFPSKMRNERTSRSKMNRRTSIRINTLEPFIVGRNTPIRKENTDIEMAKETLHVSAVPKTLPCREKEFKEIYNFIESKILDDSGGCMYVSGVPGAGKTSTITEAINSLKLQAKLQKLPEFDYIEINGMQLTDPRHAYVHIYHQLTSERVTWQHAHSLLEDLFNSPVSKRKAAVLMVDEFDALKSHRQDVLYNLLDWTTKRTAKLFVIAIANIIDPERLLAAGVASRLGSTRIIFQPYTQYQLQTIVQARLTGTDIFENDALQLVTRKVASISGDCRRALDICRRAVEIAEKDCFGQKMMVTMSHVQKAFDEMITSPKVIGIRGSSKHEKLFLQAVAAEVARTGVDETVLLQVYRQFETICALNGVNVPEPGIALRISCRLGSSGLLISEHSNASIHQKIMLNVSQNELSYAFDVSN